MASYALAAGAIGSAENTLTPSTVDTVTFAGDMSRVTVVNMDGAAAIYYTLDGSTPTVGGANCFVVPASVSWDTRDPGTGAATVVKLVSAGSPKYRVQRED